MTESIILIKVVADNELFQPFIESNLSVRVCVCVRLRPDVRHQRIHMSQHHRCDIGEDEGRRGPDDQSGGQEAQTLLEPPHDLLSLSVRVCVCDAGSLCPVHNSR